MNSNRFTGLLALLGLAAVIIGFVVMLLIPGIRYAAWAILILGAVLMVVAFVLDFRRVRKAITGRRGRFGVSATVASSIFVGILLLANGIGIGAYHRFDTTALSQFTLTSQTKEVLDNLTQPIKVLCFFTPDDATGIGNYAASLLNEYSIYSNKLSIQIIDPDEHPDQARTYNISMYQTIVFESGDKRISVLPSEMVVQTGDSSTGSYAFSAEHPFTSAILQVTGVVQKIVYFLTGHGESDPATDYSVAADGLLDDLFFFDTVNLIDTPEIPQDCAALIIASPKQAMLDTEISIIEHYLKTGGQVLLMVNPDYPADMGELTSQWGVDIQNGVVIDPTSYMVPSKDIPIISEDRNAFSLPSVYFPATVAMIPRTDITDSDTLQRMALAWTSKSAWLDKDFDPEKEPEMNGDEKAEVLTLGVLIAASPTEGANGEEPTDKSKVTRLIVIGDSDFASNTHYYNGNNSDLFLNSVRWLTEEAEIISINRTVLPFRRLVVGPGISSFIGYSSVALIPIVVLVIGGVIWWQRR